MYYVLHRPHGSDKPWDELPGFRSKKPALDAVKTLERQKDPDGSRLCDVKLCVGKGRDRRDISFCEER